MTPQLHCEIPPLRLLTQLLWPTLFICRWKACDQSADSIHTRPGTVKYTQHHDQPEGPGRFWPLLTTTLSGLTAQIIPLSCNLLTQHWLESNVRVKDFGLWPYFNRLEVPQLLLHLLWITAVKCIHSRKCKSLSFGWKGPLQSMGYTLRGYFVVAQLSSSSSPPLGWCLQGWPQPIICVPLTPSSPSSSITD